MRIRLHHQGAGGGQIGSTRLRLLDQPIDLVDPFRQRDLLHRDVHFERGVRRKPDGRRQDPADHLDLPLHRLQPELRLRQRRLRLQDVGDRAETGVVPPFGGIDAGPGLLDGRLLRPLERPCVEVLVVRMLDLEDRRLDRGVVRPVGGDQGLTGLRDRRLPAAEVQKQVVQHDGGVRGRRVKRELSADRGALHAARRLLAEDRRIVSAALAAELGGGGARLRPRGAGVGIVPQRQVDEIVETEPLRDLLEILRDRRGSGGCRGGRRRDRGRGRSPGRAGVGRGPRRRPAPAHVVQAGAGSAEAGEGDGKKEGAARHDRHARIPAAEKRTICSTASARE